jgi:hypothetical protein
VTENERIIFFFAMHNRTHIAAMRTVVSPLEGAITRICSLAITAFVLVAATCGWLAVSACPIIIAPLAVSLVPLALIVWDARRPTVLLDLINDTERNSVECDVQK